VHLVCSFTARSRMHCVNLNNSWLNYWSQFRPICNRVGNEYRFCSKIFLCSSQPQTHQRSVVGFFATKKSLRLFRLFRILADLLENMQPSGVSWQIFRKQSRRRLILVRLTINLHRLERSQLSPRAALTAYNHCASCLSHLVDSHGHEAIISMDYDSTNNVFFQ